MVSGPLPAASATAEAPSDRARLRGLAKRLQLLVDHSSPAERYTKLEQLAIGGMGDVVAMRDELLRREVVGKRLLAAPAAPSDRQPEQLLMDILGRPWSEMFTDHGLDHNVMLSRFLDEAEIQAQLDHPSILPIHELIMAGDDRVTVVMMRASSRTLGTLIQSGLAWRERVEVLLQAAWGLAFAHRKGVIHRDVKPSNILLGHKGEAYLADWGLAMLTGRSTAGESEVHVSRGEQPVASTIHDETHGSISGTPAYMSPEAARGEKDQIGPWSDVFSLGATLFEALCGTTIHRPERPTLMLERVRDFQFDPRRVRQHLPGAPRSLVDLCASSLQRDPSARPADAEVFAQQLRAALR